MVHPPGGMLLPLARVIVPLPAAAVTVPQVLELASYPAILACVAGGRCAGVVPEAVVDLLHTPPALRWVPLGPCDTVLVHRTGYATPALAALQAALHGAQDTPSVLAPDSSLRS